MLEKGSFKHRPRAIWNMIESAAFAAVLINYDLRARGRLGDAHLKGSGMRTP